MAPAPKLRGSAAATVQAQEERRASLLAEHSAALAKEARAELHNSQAERSASAPQRIQKRSKVANAVKQEPEVAVKQEPEAAVKQEPEVVDPWEEAAKAWKRRRVEVKQEPDVAAGHWSETLEQLRREQAEEAGEAASSSVALPVLHRGKSLY